MPTSLEMTSSWAPFAFLFKKSLPCPQLRLLEIMFLYTVCCSGQSRCRFWIKYIYLISGVCWEIELIFVCSTVQNDRRLEIRASEVKIRKKEKYARSDDLLVQTYSPTNWLTQQFKAKSRVVFCGCSFSRCLFTGSTKEVAPAFLPAPLVGHSW